MRESQWRCNDKANTCRISAGKPHVMGCTYFSIRCVARVYPPWNWHFRTWKWDGWNTVSFPFGAFRPIFRGENVSFREGKENHSGITSNPTFCFFPGKSPPLDMSDISFAQILDPTITESHVGIQLLTDTLQGGPKNTSYKGEKAPVIGVLFTPVTYL